MNLNERLLTRVQKLTEDLQRMKPHGVKNAASSLKGSEAKEAYALIDDLRSQVTSLKNSNSQMRNKMNHLKSLNEATSRRSTVYEHIRPRVNTVGFFRWSRDAF